MRSWTIAFFFGISIVNCSSQLPSVYEVVFALSVLGLVYYVFYSKHVIRIIFAFCFGVLWILIFIHLQWIHSLPKDFENKTVNVIGTIATIPEQQNQITKFNFNIRKIQNKNNYIYENVRTHLSYYGKDLDLIAGQTWKFSVRLKRPHGLMNPGGFDYEAWLFENKIRATGYVIENNQNKLLRNDLFSHPIDRIREKINNRINQILENNPTNGLIRALTVGVRDGITQDQWQVFRKTGTTHLMAISGLHIGLCAGFFYFLINLLWRRLGNLPLKIPSQKAAAIAAIIGALFYSLLSGFALPAQRSLIMIAIFMLGIIRGKHLISWNAICLALLIILLIDPFATLSPGFWLSFSAVALINYGLNSRIYPSGFWWKWGRIHWVITLGLLPITLFCFQQVSLFGFVSNIFAIPTVSIFVVPICLLGVLFLFISPIVGSLLLKLSALLMFWIVTLLRWISSFQFLFWQHSIHDYRVLITSTIGVLLLIMPKGFPGRWIGVIWILPLCFCYPAMPKYGDLWFTLLDVGQGLSAVVRTQHHVLIYDTGPRLNPSFDTGTAVVLPYLSYEGIKKVNMLVISHGDNDHIGGADSILQNIPVKKIVTSVPDRFPKMNAKFCKENTSWNWDGVRFEFLYPSNKLRNLGNNSSCVLLIQATKQGVLLTGDIEKDAEKYLLQHDKNRLNSTILVAPHHGSRTSSGLSFIKAVDPKYVLFPVGYLNRYHFPNDRVVKRYKYINAELFDTANFGAIEFKITKNKGLKGPSLYREKHFRYWNFHPLCFRFVTWCL